MLLTSLRSLRHKTKNIITGSDRVIMILYLVWLQVDFPKPNSLTFLFTLKKSIRYTYLLAHKETRKNKRKQKVAVNKVKMRLYITNINTEMNAGIGFVQFIEDNVTSDQHQLQLFIHLLY